MDVNIIRQYWKLHFLIFSIDDITNIVDIYFIISNSNSISKIFIGFFRFESDKTIPLIYSA
jgi:hypothetical protein